MKHWLDLIFPIIGVCGILLAIGGMIMTTHHSNRFRETIMKPWLEALARRDFDACKRFDAASDASNADWRYVMNPLRWKELWFKKYVTEAEPKAVTELIQ